MGFFTKSVSMRVVLVLMACIVLSGAGAAIGDEAVVTVSPLLLTGASMEGTTEELSSVGVHLTDPGELIAGDTVFLEIWFQTVGPNGVGSAVLDISYETALLDTSVEQITLALNWMDLWGPVRRVDDAMGLITDVGGLSVQGRGVEPLWAKLATIEFDVIEAPGTSIIACTLDPGPPDGFALVGIVGIQPVDYRCVCVEESSLGTLDAFVTCLSGPAVTTTVECTCADINQDTHADLADFAAFQVVLRGD